jgi:hypothetical protein
MFKRFLILALALSLGGCGTTYIKVSCGEAGGAAAAVTGSARYCKVASSSDTIDSAMVDKLLGELGTGD